MTELRLLPILSDGGTAAPVRLSADCAEILAATAAMYRATGFQPPWIGYLAMHGDEPVGTCAFKCAPEDGKAEIAYFTFPEFEHRGFATAMARQLVALARTEAPSIVVTAQTLPVKNFSNRILENLGFRQVGTAQDPDAGVVWVWHLEKDA